MKVIQASDVRQWLSQTGRLTELTRTIGKHSLDDEYAELTLHLPHHLRFVIEKLSDERGGADIPANEFDSISFFSLCKGLFLPLSYLTPERASQIFGMQVADPPDAAGKEQLLAAFLDKELGLTLVEKLGCALGDVFLGRRSTMRRDSLLRLLLSMQLRTRRQVLDRLTRVGDIAVVFAECRPELKTETPLTASEVLRTLRFLPTVGQTKRFDVLRSLFARCGRLEAFFIARLLMRKAGFGLEYQGPLIARTLAKKFNVPEEQVAHAMALTDVFKVANVLTDEGPAGLRRIQLQPLVPVKPTLAGGTTDEIEHFPVWVERKYDGIRLMLHKSTDSAGGVLCGAYTRNRGDWLELIPGMDRTITALPAHNAIVDGELFGTVLDLDRVRPASVYEVYAALQGEPLIPVNLRFAAFDLVYLNNQDLTSRPLAERRQLLTALVQAMGGMPTPVPFSISEGQLAQSHDDLNRLFHHFRAQGYEGIITKDLNGPYLLSMRDPRWKKRKPEVTLDLAIVGATYAVTTKESAGMFGSYVLAARTSTGGWQTVGDVAGVDRLRDAEIQHEIIRSGLMTGARIERPSASGVRPGIELRPSIVVTIKFEGIARDQVTGVLALRDPKIAVIRSDKPVTEADHIDSLQSLLYEERLS
jgi:DNA ligase-1